MADKEIGKDQLTIEEIKADLQARCATIPLTSWDRLHPNHQIPLFSYRDTSLPTSGEFGPYEQVETFLSPEGTISEKAVHYLSVYYRSGTVNSETKLPDLILGETTEERYREAYKIASDKLMWLKRRGAQLAAS